MTTHDHFNDPEHCDSDCFADFDREPDAAELELASRVPRVYAWVNERMQTGGVEHFVGVAVAEDGDYIAGHVSSSLEWAKHDMQHVSKRTLYAQHYPLGYELVWFDDYDEQKKSDERFAALCGRLRALSRERC